MNNYNIIVVEDNSTMRLGIKETLKREGFKIYEFDNGVDAAGFADSQIQIAVLDLKMEPIDGIETLRRLRLKNPDIKVLMISAYGTVDDAVKAMQLGATDFLTKPFSPDELRIRINNLVSELYKDEQINSLIERNKILSDEINEDFDEIIGNSASIKNVFNTIDKVAVSDSTILIRGESGTGKELVARAVHRKSNRADLPFIKLNCGALNENLLESELFGHVKGAFTGALKDKKGRFELADKGSLFLDEIGDLPAAMQVKLLRVLQEGEFEHVGGETTIKTDVRIISATNVDLKKLVNEGKFREDLYYRLNVIPISLPSLRERKEDIPLLVDYFINRNAMTLKQQRKSISKEGLELLCSYSWPGNIRELENLIERLFVINSGNEVESGLIASHLNSGISLQLNNDSLPLDDALFNFEKQMIMQAMKSCNGVKNRAAKMLGIKTSALYYKLEKFGMI